MQPATDTTAQLADHNARLKAVEGAVVRIEGEVVRIDGRFDKLMWWIIGTLVSTVLCLAGIIIQLVRQKP